MTFGQPQSAFALPKTDAGPYVVGIGGGTASGKSTIANELSDTVIGMDRFYNSYNRPSEVNFDHPQTLDWTAFRAVMLDIRQGEDTLMVPRYKFEDASRPEWEEIEVTDDIVIIEGLWTLLNYSGASFDPTVYYDETLYVELEADVRCARRVRRDIHERGQDPEDVVERYLRDVRPMHEEWVRPTKHRADSIVRGDIDIDSITRARLGIKQDQNL